MSEEANLLAMELGGQLPPGFLQLPPDRFGLPLGQVIGDD